MIFGTLITSKNQSGTLWGTIVIVPRTITMTLTAKHYLTAFLLVFCRVSEDEVSPPPPLLVILRL